MKLFDLHFSKGPLLPVLLVAVCIVACKPGVPDRYIQPHTMEQILYDYHIADAAYRQSGSGYSSKDIIAFKLGILNEYGYTEAEFDSSMYYYVRHTELLHEVYEHLSNRLSKEALSMGASLSDVNKYDLLTEEGDTANIWPGMRAIILNPYKPFNLSTFKMEVDSTYLPGDKYILEFDTKFHFQDGMRDATAVLAMQLGNDSTSVQTTRMTSSSHYSLQLTDDKWLGVKGLEGFFMLHQNQEEQSESALHLFIIENIRLVRMHSQEEPPKPALADSLALDSLSRDSLKVDTLVMTYEKSLPKLKNK